ncbi:hypothetical protein ACFLT1_10085, partial [Bacteroidota bacterium]
EQLNDIIAFFKVDKSSNQRSVHSNSGSASNAGLSAIENAGKNGNGHAAPDFAEVLMKEI